MKRALSNSSSSDEEDFARDKVNKAASGWGEEGGAGAAAAPASDCEGTAACTDSECDLPLWNHQRMEKVQRILIQGGCLQLFLGKGEGGKIMLAPASRPLLRHSGSAHEATHSPDRASVLPEHSSDEDCLQPGSTTKPGKVLVPRSNVYTGRSRSTVFRQQKRQKAHELAFANHPKVSDMFERMQTAAAAAAAEEAAAEAAEESEEEEDGATDGRLAHDEADAGAGAMEMDGTAPPSSAAVAPATPFTDAEDSASSEEEVPAAASGAPAGGDGHGGGGTVVPSGDAVAVDTAAGVGAVVAAPTMAGGAGRRRWHKWNPTQERMDWLIDRLQKDLQVERAVGANVAAAQAVLKANKWDSYDAVRHLAVLRYLQLLREGHLTQMEASINMSRVLFCGGKYRAFIIRTWAQSFDVVAKLPQRRQGCHQKRRAMIDDEDTRAACVAFLRGLPVEQRTAAAFCAWFSNEFYVQKTGARRATPIAESTAREWFEKIGFEMCTVGKGVYADGHEREDVVQYRREFVVKMAEFQERMETYSGANMAVVTPPAALGQRRRIVLAAQDETTF